MITKEWVAIHRRHHVSSDKPGDPHSPHVFGIWRVLFGGALLYRDSSKNFAIISQYGLGTPDDWIERKVYTPYNFLGILIMLWIDLQLFGLVGLIIWAVQMIWIPFWAAGVINGLAHWWGYRNGETKDKSKNISPWGIIIGGECLHNNHHLEPANPRLSRRWFEFDIGWMYIKIFEFLRLLKIK
jgi:stearoyl-CoA desaturase (delta-9 desaturase)